MKSSESFEKENDIVNATVVSIEEGVVLGSIIDIFMDPASQRLCALAYRERILGKKFYIPSSAIYRVGEEIVFIETREVAVQMNEKNQPPGENVKTFQGKWVTTTQGDHIGHVADFDFDQSSWSLSGIIFSDGRHLPLEEMVPKFGNDEIIVPPSALDKIKSPPQDGAGLMAKLFGRETIDSISNIIQRSLKKDKKKSKLAC
jgi:uncharacterized protein YrrD